MIHLVEKIIAQERDSHIIRPHNTNEVEAFRAGGGGGVGIYKSNFEWSVGGWRFFDEGMIFSDINNLSA